MGRRSRELMQRKSEERDEQRRKEVEGEVGRIT